MYLWRRSATREWLEKNEPRLSEVAAPRLAVIELATRKKIQLEVTSQSRRELEQLANEFGGTIQKLPRDWSRRLGRAQQTKPLKIGKRLLIASSTRTALQSAGYGKSGALKPRVLIVPAGAAFGTGEHGTTAMCLRLLEKSSRLWKSGWSLLDLGTGSGILVLAAKCLGAKRTIGIDSDPVAISTAKENARLNRISGVQFTVADVCRYKFPRKINVVTANLFSELLVALLPRIKAARTLILSGFLREQERDVRRSLTRNKLEVVRVYRRGKWVAILAAGR
jgi:ribosomal protein L11 methyltransferase